MASEISDLRLFTRMVSAGSLSETARRLNSSPPAISRRLAQLEARLGVRLIDRGSRHFALTEEGSLLYQRSLSILADLDEAEAEVSAKVKAPRGPLRIGAPLQIGRQRIAPLVGAFTEQYPGIVVDLVLSDARLDIVADELDVCLHIDPPTDGSVISRKLISSRRVVCASPAYIERCGEPLTPDDLVRHDCIRLVRGRDLFDHWRFRQGGAIREVEISGTLTTNNAEVMHGWALSGHGIGLKALWDIEADLTAGRLVELLAAYACDEITVSAVYATRRHMPSRVRVFLDFIAAAFG